MSAGLHEHDIYHTRVVSKTKVNGLNIGHHEYLQTICYCGVIWREEEIKEINNLCSCAVGSCEQHNKE
ncbi:MAG TPA: hypothetical protein ENI08_02200 [Candidatus Dependentiae bacterium]|nr:hypothetical protein [Candidatus Dependentiae bacterium]